MNKFSFDDIGIGLIQGSAIKEHLVDRPNGLSNDDWYKFAGKIINILNSEGDTPIPEPEQTTDEDKMIFLNGRSNPSFRCDCLCNVFRQSSTNPNHYKCNACGAWYTGEK
jgi:hypothetical protein